MHCSFVEQQKLLVLTNEEKLFKMQLKGKLYGVREKCRKRAAFVSYTTRTLNLAIRGCSWS